jgi:hypothetical protein
MVAANAPGVSNSRGTARGNYQSEPPPPQSLLQSLEQSQEQSEEAQSKAQSLVQSNEQSLLVPPPLLAPPAQSQLPPAFPPLYWSKDEALAS